MPELETPPAPPVSEQSDHEALKASFRAEFAKQNGAAPEPPADTTQTETKPSQEKPPEHGTEESIVPKEFTGSKPKPPEEKKDPVDDILTTEERGQLTAKLGGKAQESFQKLESAARAKIQALQTQLTEARAKAEATPAGPSKEHEDALKAAHERAQQLEEKLERAAYAESPKFQKYGADISAELTAAKGYLSSDTPQAVIDVAAGLAGVARIKALRDAGLDPETIAAIGPHLARADSIRRDRDGALDSWKESRGREQQELRTRQAQEEAVRVQEERSVFDKVKAKIVGTIPAFTKVDGHDKWNAKVDENLQRFEQFAFGKGSLEELMELGAEGVGARTTAFINEELKRELATVREENSRLKAAQPGTGVTHTPPAQNKTMTDEEHYRASFNAAKAQVAG